MGEHTEISWCHHTFNPWIGCTKVSAACDFCYAEVYGNRFGVEWGGERRRTSESNWRLPLRWDRAAALAGERRRVFCASLADVFDNQVPMDWRVDLWALIAETPNLDWLLLTKRPQNIAKMLPGSYVEQLVGRDLPAWPWPNVWLGTTTENEAEYQRRWPLLEAIPARLRFISYEPALGPLGSLDNCTALSLPDWVICGGESGSHARPMHPIWARDVRNQCADRGIAFHFKQWGEWAPPDGDIAGGAGAREVVTVLSDGRVREWEKDFPDARLTDPKMRVMLCVGKKRAGRLLDGIEHNAFPEPRP